MIEIKTEINGQEVEISTEHRTHGNFVRIWHYDGRAWHTLYEALHPLQTDFEAVFWAAGDLWGESVDVEKLFYENGYEIYSSEDAKCEKCGRWEYHGEMVYGMNMLDAVRESLNASKWDYFCQDCYFDTQERLERQKVGS